MAPTLAPADSFTPDVAWDAASTFPAVFALLLAEELDDNEPVVEAWVRPGEADALVPEEASFLEETDCENAVPVIKNAAANNNFVFIMSVFI